MTTSERVGRTRVGAYAICIDGDRLLLCRIGPAMMGAGIWTLPGGEVEFGEDPADAALRELAEETGLVGRIGELLEVSSRLYRPDDVEPPPVHAIRVIYRVEVIGGDVARRARRFDRPRRVARARGAPDPADGRSRRARRTDRIRVKTAISVSVAAPPEVVFALARDVTRWPDLLPHYRSAKVARP